MNIQEKTLPKQAEKITDWIRETVATSGLSDVVIGLSGGIDSALSATLATLALSRDHIYCALMPYGDLNTQGVEDAMKVVEFLQLPKDHVFTINIQDGVEGLLKHVRNDKLDEIRRGNIMARVRMIYLFDLAKRLNSLVCGTENKTEHYLGYFTRFGDEASDMEPIRDLYKTEVWKLAKALEVPQTIIDKEPTAGLWEGQTDEGELGFSYEDADKVLSLHFDQGLSAEQIVNKGVPKQTVIKILERVAKNDFKHKLPYIFK